MSYWKSNREKQKEKLEEIEKRFDQTKEENEEQEEYWVSDESDEDRDYTSSSPNSLVGGVVFIVIGAVMVGNVFIPVIEGTSGVMNTTSEGKLIEGELWTLLTIFGILGLFVGIARVFGFI